MACGREVILHRLTLRIYLANLNSTNILTPRGATLVSLGECSAAVAERDLRPVNAQPGAGRLAAGYEGERGRHFEAGTGGYK